MIATDGHKKLREIGHKPFNRLSSEEQHFMSEWTVRTSAAAQQARQEVQRIGDSISGTIDMIRSRRKREGSRNPTLLEDTLVGLRLDLAMLQHSRETLDRLADDIAEEGNKYLGGLVTSLTDRRIRERSKQHRREALKFAQMTLDALTTLTVVRRPRRKSA